MRLGAAATVPEVFVFGNWVGPAVVLGGGVGNEERVGFGLGRRNGLGLRSLKHKRSNMEEPPIWPPKIQNVNNLAPKRCFISLWYHNDDFYYC